MATGELSSLDEVLFRARRNVLLLSATQAVQGAVTPIAISLGGLAGYHLLGDDKSLATAPITAFNAGTALGAAFIAIVARYTGQKASFMVGSMLAATGGAVAAVSLLKNSFWLFALGLLLIGMSSGFLQKFRFAAADASPSFFKAKAISWILAGGIVSAVIGPQVAIWMRDAVPEVPFSGPFLAILPLAFAGMLILTFLQFPEQQKAPPAHGELRPLGEIVRQPRFLTGMLCGVGSYALMTFMMTGTPLAMVVGCGYSPEMSTLGIQWHVLAMFGPSFFTGQLITRFGVEKIVAAGLLILMGCAVVAASGIALWNFWGALVLLGIGWNFGFIGSTAIITSCYRPGEGDKVQGFHDILLFSIVAVASFSAGKVFNDFGWGAMTFVIWPVTIVCLLALVNLVRLSRKGGAA
jgi:MFS family permease